MVRKWEVDVERIDFFEKFSLQIVETFGGLEVLIQIMEEFESSCTIEPVPQTAIT